MRNKLKAKLRQKNKQFTDTLEVLTNYFDNQYPGWQKSEDSDSIKRRLNRTAKIMTKTIHRKKTKLFKKKDFQDWPFTSDSIILIQTSKKMISCIIDFQEYALNGLAQTGLVAGKVFKFPHEAGKAIKGKFVSEFIKIGLKL